MSTEREVTRIVRSWLQTDEHESAERLLGTVLDRLDATPQRVPWWRAWRKSLMSATLKLAAAAIVLVVAAVGVTLLLRQSAIVPAATPQPTPTAGLPAPSGTILFGRRGGAYGDGRLFSISADGSNEQVLYEEAACCLTAVPAGGEVLYGTLRFGRIVPTWSSGAARQELTWGMELTPGYMVSSLSLAPRAATGTDQWGDDVYAMEGWDPDDGSHAGINLAIQTGGRTRILSDFVPLTTAPAGFRDVPFSFSPDGSRLLFGRLEASGGQPPFGTGDLFVIDTDGGEPRRVNPIGATVPFSDEFGAGASWSPDGSRIAFAGFSGTGEGESRVYVADGDSEGVAITEAGQWITSARWSPTADWILFDQVNDAGTAHDLYLVAPDGSGQRNLTETYNGGVCCGQWSPDGQRIVAQGQESSETSNLTVFGLDGSEPVRITEDGPEIYLWYSWTP